MTLLTSTGAGILTPEQVEALVIQPLRQQSVAMHAGTAHWMTVVASAWRRE
jgi:hypothetical protein